MKPATPVTSHRRGDARSLDCNASYGVTVPTELPRTAVPSLIFFGAVSIESGAETLGRLKASKAPKSFPRAHPQRHPRVQGLPNCAADVAFDLAREAPIDLGPRVRGSNRDP